MGSLKWNCADMRNEKGLANGSAGKEFACNAGDIGAHRFHPWVGKIP